MFLTFYLFSYSAQAQNQGKNSGKNDVSFDNSPSKDEGIADSQLRKEREAGRKTVKEIEERWELIADPVPLVRLSMIVDALKPHMEREIPYEVRIIRSDVSNAFCLPGGFIFFTSKMLQLLHSDAEIAAVMAHEMVHVDQSHGFKMAAKSEKITLAALVVMLASGGALAPVALSQVMQVAITSSYSIEFEKEADSMGLDALIAAGYPASAMVTVMEGFMHEEMKRPIQEYGIYMDHPDSIDRVRSLGEKLVSLKIAVERKHPLQMLQTFVKENGAKISLFVDDLEVWEGTNDNQTRDLLRQVRELLDRGFQMELVPYDLRLENSGAKGESVLRLKNVVLAHTPLPAGMPGLSTLRENLLVALDRARKKHPIANYFKY
ncbi:MAG: M48 family metalloprotease [Synergistaceae bacterium]|nr:M48 family metalloprotease [Synergistaceae bacterium]